MEKLQESNLEYQDLQVPVNSFISFLKSATQNKLSDETIASIKDSYESVEYSQFVDKFFDTFGSHIPGYTDEYKEVFIDYIYKNFRESRGIDKDVFWDISKEILSIIDVKGSLYAKKVSDEQVAEMIQSIEKMEEIYVDIDKNHIRLAEIKSMKNFLLSQIYNPTEDRFAALQKNLEMFQAEIEQ